MTKIDYFVTGAVGGKSSEGEIYARQEIHDLYKDKNQWQLYLLGLRKWYDIPADHPLSYFQIAGTFLHNLLRKIHVLILDVFPRYTWDAIPAMERGRNSENRSQ